ncbi:MAG TPA: GNVR domain-containing protein [Candidatus Angelobacter sp.]|nr:GNVR domain-containing protein [Candidatus Angelobacter sp.]
MTDRPTSFVDDPVLDQSKEPLISVAASQAPEGGFLDILLRMAEWKRFIFTFVFCAAVFAAIVALIWPKSYTATAKIMPPQEHQSSIASALMGQLGPLADLAGGGMGSGMGLGKNPADVYIYVLRSRTVADALINRFSLMKVYKLKLRVVARDRLRNNTDISSGDEGGISIAVSDHDRQRAADIANAYVDELKQLTQTLAVTEAGRRRIFYEHEVQLADDNLAQAELDMKKVQEKTGLLMPEPQAQAMLEGVAGLQAQVAVQEAEVQSMRSFATDDNPDLKRAESQLAALKAELTRMQSGKVGSSVADMDMRKVPEKELEYLRALRELKYREAVYEAMTKQLEIARVDEAKDAAVIQVLDKALPPELRSSPKRTLIVLSAAMVAFFLAAGIVLVAERIKGDPVLLARLHLLKLRLLRNPLR